jgi:hypothetical protein
MRKLLTFLIAGVLSVGLAASSFGGSMSLLGVGGSGARATTTLDPSHLGSLVTLSNGNLTATGAGGNSSARSIANHTSGKYYCETTIGQASNSIIGVIDGTASLNDWVGDSPNSAGAGSSGFSGVWFTNASGTAIASPTLTAGHTYGLAVDMTNKSIWIKDLTGGGNWNVNASANPATNVGGQSLTSITTAYVGVTPSGGGDNMTLNFGASAYVGTPPAGFGNW